MRVVKIVFAIFALIFLAGCAEGQFYARQEMFPKSFQDDDPTLGVILNEGTCALNLFILNRNGEEVDRLAINGVDTSWTVDGKYLTVRKFHLLDPGEYRVRVVAFFYRRLLGEKPLAIKTREWEQSLTVHDQKPSIKHEDRWLGWQLTFRENIPEEDIGRW